MNITCPDCHKKYIVNDSQIDLLKQKTPKCKACGSPLCQADKQNDEKIIPNKPSAPDPVQEGGDLPKTVGSFKVEKLLGKGGMGIVYKCLDESLNRHVAIKMLLIEDETQRKRFFKEAQALAKLSHPNITQIYSAGEEGQMPYFVMEYVNGPSTEQLIQKRKRLPIPKALGIAIQVCEGLKKALQSDIIHRDIKPGNILISSDGVAKITDFGLAKILTEEQHLTKTSMIMGTPLFMSPEQGRGEELDFRTDIYSLGVMLYRFIIGRLPFKATDALTLIMKHIKEPVKFPAPTASFSVPPAIAGIIRKMMAKNPDERFMSYDQLIQELTKLKKSFQALQIEGAESTVTEQAPTTSTEANNPYTNTTQLSQTVMIPQKLSSSSSSSITKFLTPIAVLILLVFFGLIFKSGMKEDTTPINHYAPVAKATVETVVTKELEEVVNDVPANNPVEIEITHHAIEEMEDDSLRVYGTIRNTGTDSINNLSVEVAFVTWYDETIQEQEILTEPKVILPGEHARFSLVFKDFVEDWDRYIIRSSEETAEGSDLPS